MRINGHDIIAKVLVGSRAYGIDIEGSDWDYKGVFIQDPLDLFLNGEKRSLKVSEDEMYYELGHFANLCLGQNPSILEILYAPDNCVIYSTEHWRRFQNKKDLILSKKAQYSYMGYIRKALAEETKSPKQRAHILRLAWGAINIARLKTLPIACIYKDRIVLMDIRSGAMNEKEAIYWINSFVSDIEKEFSKSSLREEPDREKILEKVKDIKTEYSKQYDNTRRYSEDLQAADVR